MFWVYILENPGSKFYIGQTEDLPARLSWQSYHTTTLSGLIAIHQVFQPHPCCNHNNHHKDNRKCIPCAERSIIMERCKIMVKCK